MLDGVADEVGQHLCNPIRVADDVGPSLEIQVDLLVGTAHSQFAHHGVADLVQVDRHDIQLEALSSANAGEVEHLPDHAHHSVGALLNPGNEVRLVRCQTAAVQELRRNSD